MNREILFRGKRIDNGKWVKGHYFKNENGTFIFTFPYHANYTGIDVMVKIDPKTVCQYTGYEDLRKKKAFEHDTVSYEDGGKIGHIVFKEGYFLIEWEDDDSLRNDIHFWFTERKVHIVGNIFDNPENV